MAKDEFVSAFQNEIKREGAAKLLQWLGTTDFYTAPASVRHHLACEGGLLEHSLNVWKRLGRLVAAENGPGESGCGTGGAGGSSGAGAGTGIGAAYGDALIVAPIVAPNAAPIVAPIAAPIVAPNAAPIVAPVAAPIVASRETIAICGLLHDVCKTNFYKTEYRNVKDDSGQWAKAPYYTVADQLPYGHGEKSVYIINGFLKLTREEAIAIRWHMGGFDESVKGGGYSMNDAWGKYPLAVLLHVADLQSTYIDERESRK